MFLSSAEQASTYDCLSKAVFISGITAQLKGIPTMAIINNVFPIAQQWQWHPLTWRMLIQKPTAVGRKLNSDDLLASVRQNITRWACASSSPCYYLSVQQSEECRDLIWVCFGVLKCCSVLRCWTQSVNHVPSRAIWWAAIQTVRVFGPPVNTVRLCLFGMAVKVDQRSDEAECSGGGSAAASRRLATRQITPVALVHSGHDGRAVMEATVKRLQPCGADFGSAITGPDADGEN